MKLKIEDEEHVKHFRKALKTLQKTRSSAGLMSYREDRQRVRFITVGFATDRVTEIYLNQNSHISIEDSGSKKAAYKTEDLYSAVKAVGDTEELELRATEDKILVQGGGTTVTTRVFDYEQSKGKIKIDGSLIKNGCSQIEADLSCYTELGNKELRSAIKSLRTFDDSATVFVEFDKNTLSFETEGSRNKVSKRFMRDDLEELSETSCKTAMDAENLKKSLSRAASGTVILKTNEEQPMIMVQEAGDLTVKTMIAPRVVEDD